LKKNSTQFTPLENPAACPVKSKVPEGLVIKKEKFLRGRAAGMVVARFDRAVETLVNREIAGFDQ